VTQEANPKKSSKLKDYLQLIKMSLSIMVVFSSVICYLLAPKVVAYDWWMIFLLFVGGMLVTGSANAINQTVERDTDAVMRRTASRPIAAGRMSTTEGWVFAIITGVAGVLVLGVFFNWLSAGLAAFSLFLYAFIYTPLKKVSAVSVVVGAFPGALPCLIGYAAGNDDLSGGGWVLFGIQFLWQFPHFWAIAWLAHQDYAKAGFKMLPNQGETTRTTAMQTVIYSILLLPACMIPYYMGLTEKSSIGGMISMAIVILVNFFLIVQCVRLYKEMTQAAARRVMFSSYIYLPVVLFALLAAKQSSAI
jgi:protoheme IX farnesyltransferase